MLYAQSTTKDYIRAGGDFKEIHIVEKTNRAGIRLEGHSEKVESCPQNLWNEILLKGPSTKK